MATTVHIPNELLRAVDERAKRLKLTRSRFVVEALKKVLAERDQMWSPEFIERARHPEVDSSTIDTMLDAIKKKRSSKKSTKL